MTRLELAFERVVGFLEAFPDSPRYLDLCVLLREIMFESDLGGDVWRALGPVPFDLHDDVLCLIAVPPELWPERVVDAEHLHWLLDR